jgi:hypothetical protein
LLNYLLWRLIFLLNFVLLVGSVTSEVTKNRGYDNAIDKGKYFLVLETRFYHRYVTTWKKLESETMYLVDISRVDEELATDALELIGARSGHLCDDMWYSLWWRGGCACRAPRWPAVLVTSRSLNGNACRGVSSEYIEESVSLLTGRVVLFVGGRKVTQVLLG